MTKNTLLVLLIAAIALSAFLAYRVQDQSEEFARARQIVGYQTTKIGVLTTILNSTGLNQETTRKILEEAYPGESLGPYSRQLVSRDVDIYFYRDSISVSPVSSVMAGWACGSILGCETAYDQTFISSSSGHFIARLLTSFPYHLVAISFGIAALILWRRRQLGRSMQIRIAAKASVALFLLTFLIFWSGGELLFEIAPSTGVSYDLMRLGWNEISRLFLIGSLLSIALVLVPYLTTNGRTIDE